VQVRFDQTNARTSAAVEELVANDGRRHPLRRNEPTEAVKQSPSVTIVQRVLPHYRIALFEGLHSRLARAGIEMRLVYGQEYPGTVPATVEIDREWAFRMTNRYLTAGGYRAVWQPCFHLLDGASLVIVEQANALLLNYVLLGLRMLGKGQVAFWGHGRNMQARDDSRFSECLKAGLVSRVDWWFAYTDMSAGTVIESGFPRERITVVQNAIDTVGFRESLDRVTAEQTRALKERLGIEGENIAVYCGGLYPDKKLDFLLEACRLIRRQVGDFHVLFIGSGPEAAKLLDAARRHDWIRFVGAKFGSERAEYFKASRLMLMPGLVGLAVVDSFVARTPLFTTDLPIHSPEIAYLSNGNNGVMTAHDVAEYANAVSRFLLSPSDRERLRKGCERSASEYTMENFIERFARGIEQCLSNRH
jgi:glycosyltransferase involved in cell wall biosynthesis